MNGPSGIFNGCALLGVSSIARWLLEPLFYQVYLPDLTVMCTCCEIAVNRINKLPIHDHCGQPIRHPLLNDPIINHLVILYDDHTCGRRNFHDDLMIFRKCNKQITILERIPNQMTMPYLIKGQHYTSLIKHDDIKWPARQIKHHSQTLLALAWVGEYWPGCGLDEVIKKYSVINMPILAYGMAKDVVSYSYYLHMAETYKHVAFSTYDSPELCITEASKCRWLTFSQPYRWLQSYCSAGCRALVNDDNIDLLFNHDLEALTRYINTKNSFQKYSRISDLSDKW